MRRPKSRSAMALAEPRFDLGNLGELLRRQLALQSFDRLGKVFSVPAALDGVVGKTLGVREGLALGVRCRAAIAATAESWSRSARR